MLRLWRRLLIAVLPCLIGFSRLAVAQVSPWPMFQHDQLHTGRSSFAGPAQAETLWTRMLDDETIGPNAAPVIGNNGAVLIGTLQGEVYAFSSHGARLWKKVVPGVISAPLGVANNGRIFVPVENDTSYVLDPADGHVLWHMFLGFANSGPTIVGNYVFVSGTYSGVGFVWKLDLQALAYVWQSSHLWQLDRSAPVVALGGQVAAGSTENIFPYNSSGRIWVLGANGQEQCHDDLGFFRGRGIRSTLSQTSTGKIVGGSVGDQASSYGDGVFFSSDITCTSCSPPDIGHYFSSPALTSSNIVVIGTKNGLSLRDPTNCGQTALYPTGPILNPSPVIDHQGNIYVGDDNGRLWAWSTNGSQLWNWQLDAAATSSAIDGLGNLFVASTNGRLYCFAGPGSVGVDKFGPPLTARLRLWPNPMTTETNIHLAVTEDCAAHVSVHDISGRVVANVFNGHLPVGSWSWTWHGQNDRGESLARGVYWVTLLTESHRITTTVVLLR